MGNEASSRARAGAFDPGGRGPGIMLINGVVCSWGGVEEKVRKKIAAGHDLNQTRPFVVAGIGDGEDQKNPEGMTYLHLACAMKHERLVRTLLENGADVSPRDVRGRTPLVYAHDVGADEIVGLLMRHAADPNREFPGAPSADPATAGAAASNSFFSSFFSSHADTKTCAAAGCSNKGVKKCSKCRATYYCCKACQKTHWKKHKKECYKMVE